MGLLKKVDKSKPLKIVDRGGTGGTVSALRPVQQGKLPPCTQNCPSGNDVRGWLTVIAEREKTGMSVERAYDRAFEIETDTNPFPAISMGTAKEILRFGGPAMEHGMCFPAANLELT